MMGAGRMARLVCPAHAHCAAEQSPIKPSRACAPAMRTQGVPFMSMESSSFGNASACAAPRSPRCVTPNPWRRPPKARALRCAAGRAGGDRAVARIARAGRSARPAGAPAARRAAPARATQHAFEGRAVLLHALAHIEFNAINLALDAVWRFAGLPAPFYADWLKVAAEEAITSRCCPSAWRRSGMRTAIFPRTTACGRCASGPRATCWRAWHSCRARSRPAADASPPIRARLVQAGDDASAAILDVILRDEIGHVAIGNRWFRHLCDEAGRDPVPTYRQLAEQYHAAAARPVQFRCAPRCRIRAGRTRRTGRTGRGGGRRATPAGSRSAALRRAARRPKPGHGVSPRPEATRAARAAPRLPDAGKRRRRYNRTIILFLAAAMSASSSVSDFVTVRGVQLHVRRWGRPDAPTLFMLHGWMDVSASFQFVVDALAGDWQVIAPDARGFGLSDWPVARQGGGHYWFHEYLGDLDALVDHYAPAGEVNLVGHSMGANVVPVCRRAAGARAARGRSRGFRAGARAGRAGAAPVARLAGRVARTARAAPLCIPRRRGGAPDQDQSAARPAPCGVPRRALVEAWRRRSVPPAGRPRAQDAGSCTGSTK